MNPQLNNEIGYKLTKSSEMEQQALHEAFELVRQTRQIGAKIRTWAFHANLRTNALLLRLQSMRSPVEKPTPPSNEKKIWEMSCWESQILNILGSYMNETTALINRLKPLNPPLTSAHLRPFTEAMLMDRQTTVSAMEPLTKTIAKLTIYKLDLRHQNPEQILDYTPLG